MNTDVRQLVTRSGQHEWLPLVEPGVNTKGIFVKVLRYDEQMQRAPVFLLKFDAGASYPFHDHPAGEEAFVLEGEVAFEGEVLSAGDYLLTPPGGRHGVRSERGCVVLFIVPQEVEILPE